MALGWNSAVGAVGTREILSHYVTWSWREPKRDVRDQRGGPLQVWYVRNFGDISMTE